MRVTRKEHVQWEENRAWALGKGDIKERSERKGQQQWLRKNAQVAGKVQEESSISEEEKGGIF